MLHNRVAVDFFEIFNFMLYTVAQDRHNNNKYSQTCLFQTPGA